MKCIIVCLLLAFSVKLNAQHKAIDSLKIELSKTKADTNKVKLLSKMGDLYSQSQPDSEIYVAQQALFISREAKFIKGEMWSLKQIAEGYESLGNYPLALNYYLQRLRLDEKYPNPDRETVTLLSIATLYQSDGDYRHALAYLQKAYKLIDEHKLENYRWYSYVYFGDIYEKINNIPKAIFFDKKALSLARQAKNKGWEGMCLNNLGNAYTKAKKNDIALSYYHAGIPYLVKDNNESFLCESYTGIATVLNITGKLDSAAYFAKRSLQLADSRNFNDHYLSACKLLSDIYKKTKFADSTILYQSKLLAMKDRIYSKDKIKQLENLTVLEIFRQKDIQQQKLLEKKHTAYKMNMLLIGLLIPLFFIASVVLSKKKTKAKVVEFSGILSLLLLFEYLNLLMHHFIGSVSDESPFVEILLLMTLAAILTPSHHRIERWLLSKLTQKAQHKNHSH